MAMSGKHSKGKIKSSHNLIQIRKGLGLKGKDQSQIHKDYMGYYSHRDKIRGIYVKNSKLGIKGTSTYLIFVKIIFFITIYMS